MDEEASNLKLVIEKGPREGETLHFRPGSVIRMGRVVRGITLAIKDAGISTKYIRRVHQIGKMDHHRPRLIKRHHFERLQNGAVWINQMAIKVVHEADAIRLRRNPTRGDSKVNLASIGEGVELGLAFGGELVEVFGGSRFPIQSYVPNCCVLLEG